MVIRTKIICTIGPSVDTKEQIVRLVDAGMHVARLNFSHGDYKKHGEVIRLLKEVRKEKKRPLAILLDTKGPEIRVGKIHNNEMVLKEGDRFTLIDAHEEGIREKRISIIPYAVLEGVQEGTHVLFDDGYITTRVVTIKKNSVVVEVLHGGLLRSGKGVYIPDIKLNLPAVTERDVQDIRFGCQNDVDMIAASFVNSAEHVVFMKIVEEEGEVPYPILAKIENREGLNNIDSIIQVADGIMIARGDLGVEIPLSQVPQLQKEMIRKCYEAGKMSVTATQMLESMIQNSRPTRAEVSDVANAIHDGTSAVMLSGETAVGKYPIQAVDVMKSIIKETEAHFPYHDFFRAQSGIVYNDVPSCVALAAVKTAHSSQARAIFAFTHGGATAQLLSRFRPDIPILAMTPNKKCYHQLAAVWGVIPFYHTSCATVEEAFSVLSQKAIDANFVSDGDFVVITAGTPFGIAGTTNMMLLESIGDVLIRGYKGGGGRVHGKVVKLFAPEEKKPYEVSGKLLVITKCDGTYAPFIEEAAGVILQNLVDDKESEKNVREYAKTSNTPYILRADAATQVLQEGQLVTLDTRKGLVYKGVANPLSKNSRST